MAGYARREAVEQELKRRTMATFGQDDDAEILPTELDYVCGWLESGHTLKALAMEITARLHFEVNPAFLQRTLRQRFGEVNTDSAISDARVRASHQYAEDALSIVDEPAESQVEVSRAASRARSRQWLAEKYNPKAFGVKQDASVTINVASLHLSALQALPRSNGPTPQLGSSEDVVTLLPSQFTVSDTTQVVD